MNKKDPQDPKNGNLRIFLFLQSKFVRNEAIIRFTSGIYAIFERKKISPCIAA